MRSSVRSYSGSCNVAGGVVLANSGAGTGFTGMDREQE